MKVLNSQLLLLIVCFLIVEFGFSHSGFAQLADLTPVEISAPSEGNVGSEIEVTVTAKNRGLTAAREGWIAEIFLTKYTVVNRQRIRLAAYTISQIMPANATKSVEAQILIPPTVRPGSYHVGIMLDATNIVPEINELNNYILKEDEISILQSASAPPDLIPIAISSYGLMAGKQNQIAATIKNQGELPVLGDWAIDLILTTKDPTPSDGLFPGLGDLIFTTIHLGRFTESASISPGSEHTSILNVDIPMTYHPMLSVNAKPLEGYFYPKIEVDPQDLIPEANENNNVFTNPNPLYVSQPPDLAPIAISGNSTADAASETAISAVICNYGNGIAWSSNAWIIGIYLQNSTSTVLVERFSEFRNFEPDFCREYTRILSLPQELQPGVYHWRIIADEYDQVEEINDLGTAELNNECNGGIIEILPVVDLAPTSVSGPENMIQGASVSVDWSVANVGTGDDVNVWVLQLVISQDDEIDGSDLVLLTKSVPPVARGSVVSWTEEIRVEAEAGTYYLGIIVDAANTVEERDEDNNLLASSRPMIVLPQPDLVPTSIQGPNQTHVGNDITVSMDITNQGSGAAPADWTRHIYLSPDAIISEDDLLLGTISATSSLNPGDTISCQDKVTILGSTPSGDYYLGIILAATFPESDISNNSIASTRVIRIR